MPHTLTIAQLTDQLANKKLSSREVTQACLNPARDFGPRIFAALAGGGEVALPGPRGLFDTLAVYLAAPVAGRCSGGWFTGSS